MKILIRAAAGALLLSMMSAPAAKVATDTLAPGDGAMLVTVSADFSNAFGSVAGQIPMLEVEQLGGRKPKRFDIEVRMDGLQATRAYAASLPPGRYRVKDLCRSCGGLYEPEATDLPEFTVEAGRTTYLGNLLVSMAGTGTREDRWHARWAWEAQPDAAVGSKLLSAVYPALSASAPLGGGGWVLEAATQADPSARGRLRREVSGLYDVSPFGDDGFVFGANSGVIKRWRPGEPLVLIDTGSPYLIRSVLHGADGRILAGGEATTLLYSEDDGRQWIDVSADLPFGVVAQIKAVGDELVFSLVHGESVALYRGRLGENRWQRIGEYPLAFKFWTGLPGMYPELHVRGRTLAMTLPSKEAVYLDLDTGESHGITLPGSVQSFSFTPDGVMRCRCSRSIAVNPWESRDLGRTWGPSTLDRFMLLPVFRSEREGFTYKGAWLDAKRAGIHLTTDGAASFSLAPPPPLGVWMAQAYSADGSLMLLAGLEKVEKDLDEAAFFSRDAGTRWERVGVDADWLYPAGAPAGR